MNHFCLCVKPFDAQAAAWHLAAHHMQVGAPALRNGAE